MNKLTNYDAVMVLGAGVFESMRRAKYAADIINNSEIPVILSGGVPKSIYLIQNSHGKSEADIMEEIFRTNGNKIYKEIKSQNTLENFVNSKKLIDKLNFKNIALIDGLVHIKRSLKIAKEVLPEYNFTGFPIPLSYNNLFVNLFIEGVSKILESCSQNCEKYHFYNNFNSKP